LGKLFYELKPWICIVIASMGLVISHSHQMAGPFSFLLLGCALMILQWRFDYRKQLRRQRY